MTSGSTKIITIQQQEEETYEDNDEDNYNPEEQEEETYEKNEISFDGHYEIELPKISRMCDICMDRPKFAVTGIATSARFR